MPERKEWAISGGRGSRWQDFPAPAGKDET